MLAKTTITDCNGEIDTFLSSFSNFEGTGNAPDGEVRGLVITIKDGMYPSTGSQVTQIFLSYYGQMYTRAVWNAQSWGTWTKIV